jgi:hypothetical protein
MSYVIKAPRFVFGLAAVVTAALLAGCNSAPRTVTITGQILVSDGGKIQNTGLAPVWIYEATNTQLTTKIPLPDFGGRSRKDWQRIVTAFPASLSVCSNYDALKPLAPKAEVKRMALAKEYYQSKQALNGQTSGPDFEAMKRLETEMNRLMAEENRLWDQADDMRDMIVLWYNINPGVLYAAGVPQRLTTVQTDKQGKFSLTLPASRKVLIAAHIEGAIDGQPGNYFWLVPFDSGKAATNSVILSGDNVSCKHTRPQMPHVILPKANGYIGDAGFWMLNRVRDARHPF